MLSKLDSWTSSYLSKAGKITLIRSCLSSIPSYISSCILLPKTITNSIDKICKDFFWGKSNLGNKRANLIAWKQVCTPKKEGGLGITDAHTSNVAAAVKLCWNIHSKPGILHDFFRDKYTRNNGSLISFKRGSFIWQNIGRIWDHFKKTVGWIPTKSSHLSLWEDNWTLQGNLSSILQGPLPSGASNLKIKDIFENGKFNENICPYPLPKNILAIINSTFSNYSDNDLMVCTISNGLFFNTHSLRQLIKPADLESNFYNSKLWDLISATNILPKIQIFIWQLYWESIPTTSTLYHHHHPTFPQCPQCPFPGETPLHCLRDCLHAKGYWLELKTVPPKFFQLNLQEWITTNLADKGNYEGFTWNLIFSYSIWQLWLRRNSKVFGKKWKPNPTIVRTVRQLCIENTYLSNNDPTQHTNPKLHLILPNKNLYIFCDASHDPISLKTIPSFVVINKSGHFLLGGFYNTVSSDPILAEILAIQLSVQWISQSNEGNAVIISDCKHAVNLLQNEHQTPNKYSLATQLCRSNRSWMRIQCMSLPREAVGIADAMNKEARAWAIRDHCFGFTNVPPQLLKDKWMYNLASFTISDFNFYDVNNDLPLPLLNMTHDPSEDQWSFWEHRFPAFVMEDVLD